MSTVLPTVLYVGFMTNLGGMLASADRNREEQGREEWDRAERDRAAREQREQNRTEWEQRTRGRAGPREQRGLWGLRVGLPSL